MITLLNKAVKIKDDAEKMIETVATCDFDLEFVQVVNVDYEVE